MSASAPPPVSGFSRRARTRARMRRSTIEEGKKRTNMGDPIRTRKGKLAGKGKHDARLGRVSTSKWQ